MNALVDIIGLKGVIGIIGFSFFLLGIKYAHKIFDIIEKNTFGTRNFIMEKLEFLYIELKSQHVTYILIFLSFGFGLIILIICGFFALWIQGIFLAAFVSFLGWKIPKPFINYLIEQRIKAYRNQMVDALTLLANGVRAGLSLPQAISMIVNEMPPPISQEFNMILQQNRIGAPIEECFENLAKRVPLEDNDMFVASVNILRETGGNLAEVFDTIVNVIRERVRLQQKIDTYIAQGFIQGLVIASMPIVLLIGYSATDFNSVKPLFTTPVGMILLFIALGLDALGAVIIMKIIKIRV